MDFILKKWRDVPFHMTPTDVQIMTLDIVRKHIGMENVRLGLGVAEHKGLNTDINRMAYMFKDK